MIGLSCFHSLVMEVGVAYSVLNEVHCAALLVLIMRMDVASVSCESNRWSDVDVRVPILVLMVIVLCRSSNDGKAVRYQKQ
mmetsp:Transcript_37789/g.64482  ORF Transcript_37789/g.64482 Transcript_37789/m.64482 type:complete len:81 (-) Transcript_37789:49-291(-)